MEYALILMNQVFIMFLLLSVGYILYKIKFLSDDTIGQMTKLVLHVIMPALILNTYQIDYDPDKAINLLIGFCISAISIFIAIILSKILIRKSNNGSIETERFCVIFTNCGFMAIPLMDALFGQIGVFYCNTYLTVFNLIAWTYGVMLMSDKKRDNKKKGFMETMRPFCSMTMLSIFLGIAMYFLRIKFPQPIVKAIGYLSGMNTPLAMIISGAFIARSNLWKALMKLRVYYITVLKCFVVPLVILVFFYFLPLDKTLKLTILITASCPTASNAIMFANCYGRDVETASNIFTITTLISIISLPIILLFAQNLF